MNKIIAYENSYVDIDEKSIILFSDLIEIGFQIKNELGLKYSPIQSVSARKVYVGNIIGNITLNNTTLIIYPKYTRGFTDELTDFEMKRLFSRTLKCSGKNLQSTVYFYKNNVISDQNDFFDVLAEYYLGLTQAAIKKSKICLYEERVEKVNTIKGRILVQKQLARPMSDTKTWCKFKRLSDNHIYTQLLGWCCRYLSELTSNFDYKRKLLVLSREFSPQINLLSTYAVKKMKLLRQFSEYDESLTLAKNLYLDSCNIKEKLEKGNRVCGYAINMERSFENIVGVYSKKAADACGFRHKVQATRQLATSIKGEGYGYDVRPDDLISKENNTLILDAKYKTISDQSKSKKKPSSSDFYQMISSCIAYDCHEAVLIYPESIDFPHLTWSTDKTVNGFNIIVRVETINLALDDDSLVSQLVDIVKQTTFYKEVCNG